MFILSSVIMKRRCSLDMSNPFVNLIFYSELGFYSDLLFIFIPHIFKATCAGFLRFMLFPSVLWEGVSTMPRKERAYLLFLSPIRWGSLDELAATELPGGRSVGCFLCGIKGLCSFEGLQALGELEARDGCVSLKVCPGEQEEAPGVMDRIYRRSEQSLLPLGTSHWGTWPLV